MSNYDLIFDLETIRDPENPGPTEGLPPAPHHLIVSSARMLLKDLRLVAIQAEKVERDGVLGLVKSLNDSRVRAITWNGRRFDFPVLGARCMALGIPFPRFFREGRRDDDFRYRYSERPHFDLMDFFSGYGSGMNSSLDAFSKLIGMPGTKGETDGSNVARLHAEGQLDAIVTHNLEDILSTAEVYLRMLFVREVLTAEEYRELAVDLLRAATGARPDLVPFVNRVNLDRLTDVSPRVQAEPPADHG